MCKHFIQALFNWLNTEQLIKETRNDPCGAWQRSLTRLLHKSSQTRIGKKFGLYNEMSIKEFQANVPIMEYVDFALFFKQILCGDENVLWPGKPYAFVTTSGTSQSEKVIPITIDFLNDFHRGSALAFSRFILQHPKIFKGKILTLGGPSIEDFINSIPVGSITGQLYSSIPYPLSEMLAIPAMIFNVKDYDYKLYLIARLALESRISGIISVIPSSLLILNNQINKQAIRLIKQINDGTVNIRSGLPKELVRYLKSRKPNPKRASHLLNILMETGSLQPKDIWPISALCCYTKEVYPNQWDLIQKTYGNLTLIDPGLVASEGRISIGLNKNDTSHVILPIIGLIEFSPFNNYSGYSSNTVLPYEVIKDELYSPVISYSNGLLRYRLHDVVKVTKLEKGIPHVEFLGRTDNSISVSGEKVSDFQLRRAIEHLTENGLEIHGNWAVRIDWVEGIPNYCLWIESNSVKNDYGTRFDEVLKVYSVSYKRKRDQCILNQATVKLAEIGTVNNQPDKYQWIGQTKPKILISTTAEQ